MGLQGNLRDFSLSEILQLLGTQKKTGCLRLDRPGGRAQFYVIDGRIVSTREPGLAADDPLLGFLLQVHRLSDEQQRGIGTLQRESNRDLEDLLVSGRYLQAEELALYIERQILEEMMAVTRWPDGTYEFDPSQRWPNPPLVRLSVEGVLMETARRVDEQKRLTEVFQDPHQLLGVRDLPDPEQPLSEEESELFGIVDGRHTVAEIVEAAPLSEFEAYEVLHRMLELNWIEVAGRRDPGAPPAPVADPAARVMPAASVRPVPWVLAILREVGVAMAVAVLAACLFFGARALRAATSMTRTGNEFASIRVRDVRFALDLYKREHGLYPGRLEDLVEERWLSEDALRTSGRPLRYRLDSDLQEYDLRF